jgi:hypothetical protein
MNTLIYNDNKNWIMFYLFLILNMVLSPIVTTLTNAQSPTFLSHFQNLSLTCNDASYDQFANDHVRFPPIGLTFPSDYYDGTIFDVPKMEVVSENQHNSLFLNRYETSLKMLHNATIWRIDTSTFVSNNLIWTFAKRCSKGRDYRLPRESDINEIIYIDSAVISPSELWADAFYHSIAEQVIPLALVRKQLHENPNLKLIFAGAPSGVHGWLDLLHISSDRIVILSSNRLIKVKQLFFPLYASCGYLSEGILREFHKWIRCERPELFPWESDQVVAQGHVLLIDRIEGGACNRCLRNTESEIIPALKAAYPKREIKHVILGKYTYSEQVKLFSMAALIVGPHGAGYTNMVFANNHVNMVEIFNDEGNILYTRWAAFLHINYKAIRTWNMNHADVKEVVSACLGLMKE